VDHTEIFATLLTEFPLALFGSILVGVTCAFLGVTIVAKRVVFLGAVLTQVSVLGLAVTFLPWFALPHTVGSLVFVLVTVVILSRMLTGRKIPRDVVLGVVFASSIAARILILQKATKVEAAEIETLLRGDILFVTPDLFFLMLGGFVVGMGVYLLFFKEFSFIAFDAETAAAQGYRAGRWELAFYLLAGTLIAFATHMVGDLLVFGFLVLPAVTALLLTRRVRLVYTIAVVIGALAPVAGLYLAFRFDLPSSPAIVGVAFVVLAAVWLQTALRGRRRAA
jgi:ABC-type Mn2+/Zn2+ transport system permease subunit